MTCSFMAHLKFYWMSNITQHLNHLTIFQQKHFGGQRNVVVIGAKHMIYDVAITDVWHMQRDNPNVLLQVDDRNFAQQALQVYNCKDLNVDQVLCQGKPKDLLSTLNVSYKGLIADKVIKHKHAGLVVIVPLISDVNQTNKLRFSHHILKSNPDCYMDCCQN